MNNIEPMAIFSPQTRVAVIRGGQSTGYETSLKTGGHILSTLREMPESYDPIDIFISQDGEWHYGGLVQEPHELLRHADVVWNALHGSYGEDGKVQRLLESLQIPFTGSSSVASALSMDKDMAKRIYRQHSFLVPAHELITRKNWDDRKLVAIFRNYLPPVVVKPANGIHSFGVRLAHDFSGLKEIVDETFRYSPRLLVEEFIKGDDVSCTVIEDAKGERIYALLPSSAAKLKMEENKEIEEIAKRAHAALGLRHYSSSDFIITPKRKIYILETNSLPVLHENSLVHKSLRATGWRSRDFVDHIIKLALV